MVGRIVEERKTSLKKTDENGPIIDALDVLLRESSDSSDTERLPFDFISGNIIEMMVPGEETMPTAMTLAVKFLSDCPVALEKLMVRNRLQNMVFTLTSIIIDGWDYFSVDGPRYVHFKIYIVKSV